jgi:hypothetical protein
MSCVMLVADTSAATAARNSAEQWFQQQKAPGACHDNAELGRAASSAARTFRQRNAEPAHFRGRRPVLAPEAIAVLGAGELLEVLEGVLVGEEIAEAVVQELALLAGECGHYFPQRPSAPLAMMFFCTSLDPP